MDYTEKQEEGKKKNGVGIREDNGRQGKKNKEKENEPRQMDLEVTGERSVGGDGG